MEKEFLPLFAANVLKSTSTTVVFQNTHSRWTVNAPCKLIKALIALCDGEKSFTQIIELLRKDWDEEDLRNLINGLRKQGILVNKFEISEEIWKMVKGSIGISSFLSEHDKSRLVTKARKRHRKGSRDNSYQAIPTAYESLLSKRHSVRSFRGCVPFQSIINMLWSAYGEIDNNHRTVPSAGALYPLKFYLALLQPVDNILPALYQVNFGPEKSIGLKLVSEDLNRLSRSFVDPMILEGAHGVVIICGSLHFTAEKYGSRSVTFVALEAGHAAQNICISAAGQGVATLELGGFMEDSLSRAMRLTTHHPLLSVVFGNENPMTNSLGKSFEVQWALPTNNLFHPSFAIASARVSSDRSWSHGRDMSPKLAYTKAVSEAKEWAACGNIPGDLIQSTLSDLSTAIDPRSVIKFHTSQYRLKMFPFKPFDEKGLYAWKEGYDEIEGSKVHVLADHIYFPYFPKTSYYCYANSSGVAAHPIKEKALEKSVLELIERDAFMLAYLCGLSHPIVNNYTMPAWINKRIKEIGRAGFKVVISDFSLDLAPVIYVSVQNELMGSMICAACADFNIEHAVDHALMEVEASILARIQNGPPASIKPRDVKWPLDHGRLYGQKRYFCNANVLTGGYEKIAFSNIGNNTTRSWTELLGRLRLKKRRLISIPLYLSEKYGGNGDLHIIRSIIPGLVPMTFGFRQEPAGMRRIYTMGSVLKKQDFTYAMINKFPHPFA